ncbi:MAG: hypothetical protein Fur005_31530 [Roseiflexaceae bacterium]
MTLRPAWIDPRLQALPQRPWRKIHLDFHNSQYIPTIAEQFDPDQFGDTLLAGNVDAVVVFAKDMHGYFYYPTNYEPIHPGLDFDLLGQQVAACRARGIKVYAYYCSTWDNYLAERHPEWLVWKRDRSTYLPKFDQPPGWTALCLANEDFVQLMLDHTRETLERYELDGIWYDMPLPIGGECFCSRCLSILRSKGLDPFDTGVQRRHKQQLLSDFLRRAHEQAHAIRPGCQVDQNNQTRLGLGERAPYLDNIDIEALPTAFWGYLYFPTNVRYARTFGTSVCGMSGRFHHSWADFGGLKHPNQLLSEMPAIIANAAQCDIGDQLPPNGRLDPAVYAAIAPAYARIKQLEPYLEQAAPVVEAAIVVDGFPLEDLAQMNEANHNPTSLGNSVYGFTKLLLECKLQFDIVEVDAPIERYRLLLLPDGLSITPALAERLNAFVADGGAVIASHQSLRIAGSEQSWYPGLAIYQGESPFKPAYLKLSEGERWQGLPQYEFALYEGTARYQSSKREARVGVPLFQRGAAHYTSHAQSPFDHLTSDAAVLLDGRVAGIAWPIGNSYYNNGYWIEREVFRRLLQAVLPETLLSSNAPLSAEVTLTQQQASETHAARWMVHVVNFSPNRRTPSHCEYLEDPIPLHDINITLRVDRPIARAYLAASGEVLPLTQAHGGWHTTIPRIHFGEIVVFEESAP